MTAAHLLVDSVRMFRGSSLLLLSVSLCLCGSISSAYAQSPTYWQDVRPALRKHCIACHNVRNVKEVEVSGGLALDSYDSFMKNAKKSVVQSGKSGDSELIKRVLSKEDNLRMPPGDAKLPEEVVVLLRPDSARLVAADGAAPNKLAGRLTNVSFRGRFQIMTIEVGESRLRFELDQSEELPAPGTAIHVAVDPAGVQLLPRR